MASSALQESPSLRLQRTYPVPPEKVWQAWTTPQALTQWFGPGEPSSVTRADLDVRIGGRYHIAFTTPDGEAHDVSGVYQEVLKHRKLVFTWAWKSTPERVSRVTVALRPTAEGTELTFLHEQFFDQAARDNHERGWTATFVKLDAFMAEA
ncbi:SRPBCC domain-containing protein [Polaromonas sp. UC242_47]|uniref:SRPBCC domain-containing protein n=1 Tax=Polaromonas sp. UC242_47 TaxID=3374626 RepID=UPI003788750D